MLNQPPEYFLRLHQQEQAAVLTAAGHRRNARRRSAGTQDPVRRRLPLAALAHRARGMLFVEPARTVQAVPCEVCP